MSDTLRERLIEKFRTENALARWTPEALADQALSVLHEAEEQEDALTLLHELWGATSDAPDELDDRVQAFLIAHPSPAVAGEQDGARTPNNSKLVSDLELGAAGEQESDQ